MGFHGTLKIRAAHRGAIGSTTRMPSSNRRSPTWSRDLAAALRVAREETRVRPEPLLEAQPASSTVSTCDCSQRAHGLRSLVKPTRSEVTALKGRRVAARRCPLPFANGSRRRPSPTFIGMCFRQKMRSARSKSAALNAAPILVCLRSRTRKFLSRKFKLPLSSLGEQRNGSCSRRAHAFGPEALYTDVMIFQSARVVRGS
jgi:hypothetical protein